jgi:predicted enzyme related to lactoylglutathione lyase
MSCATFNDVAVWFEIPVTDLDRAAAFYQTVFAKPLKREAYGSEMTMAVFDWPGANVKGALVHGPHFTPGADGVLVYLNAGPDLAAPLARVESAGGKVVVGKTLICDQYGYYAVVMDTEGNRVALHSMT